MQLTDLIIYESALVTKNINWTLKPYQQMAVKLKKSAIKTTYLGGKARCQLILCYTSCVRQDTQDTFARVYVSTHNTLAREHLDTQNTLAFEHLFTSQGRQFSRIPLNYLLKLGLMLTISTMLVILSLLCP